jgi:small subunit ribosomal protein S16
MAVKLRLARAGAKKRPFYRIVAADIRSPRDGKFLDRIGYYDPKQDPPVTKLDHEKLEHWLSVGARPSEVVANLIHQEKKRAESVSETEA